MLELKTKEKRFSTIHTAELLQNIRKYLSRRSEHNSSNLALVRVVSICFGPSAVAVINGKLLKSN